jgi:hypothetical protein
MPPRSGRRPCVCDAALVAKHWRSSCSAHTLFTPGCLPAHQQTCPRPPASPGVPGLLRALRLGVLLRSALATLSVGNRALRCWRCLNNPVAAHSLAQESRCRGWAAWQGSIGAALGAALLSDRQVGNLVAKEHVSHCWRSTHIVEASCRLLQQAVVGSTQGSRQPSTILLACMHPKAQAAQRRQYTTLTRQPHAAAEEHKDKKGPHCAHTLRAATRTHPPHAQDRVARKQAVSWQGHAAAAVAARLQPAGRHPAVQPQAAPGSTPLNASARAPRQAQGCAAPVASHSCCGARQRCNGCHAHAQTHTLHTHHGRCKEHVVNAPAAATSLPHRCT